MDTILHPSRQSGNPFANYFNGEVIDINNYLGGNGGSSLDPLSISPDVWLYISRFLIPNNLRSLANFSRTSFYFLKLLRPVIFRNLKFREYHLRIPKRLEDTLNLLSTDKNLANCVQSLSLLSPLVYKSSSDSEILRNDYETHCNLTEFTNRFWGALWSLTSLRTLKITNSIFANEEEQRHFVERCSKRHGSQALENFPFTSGLLRLPSKELALPNLKSLEWKKVGGYGVCV
jgi:hypothetical protein